MPTLFIRIPQHPALYPKPRLSCLYKQSSTRKISTNKLLSYELIRPAAQPQVSETAQLPPIVFLHGLLGNKKNNKTASRHLSKNLNTELIIPDLRNHGDSFHARPHTNETMSNDVANLIKHLRTAQPEIFPSFRKFIIMGHSMGGKVALLHGLRFPETVAGVISIDNIPYESPRESLKEFEMFHIYLNHLIKHFSHSTPGVFTKMNQIDDLLKQVEQRSLVRKFILSNFARDPENHTIVSKIPMKLINESIENLIKFELDTVSVDSLTPYTQPCLVIRATQSDFVGENVDYDAISKHFTNCQVEDIESGHWVVSEKQKEFVSLVTNWVSINFETIL